MVKMINNMLKRRKKLFLKDHVKDNASLWKEGRGVRSVKVEEG
jgi:hypothetical protein